MLRTSLSVFAAILLVMLPIASPRATLEIEITSGVNAAVPIAVVPFSFDGQGQPPTDVAGVIGADLPRSGRFKAIDPKDMLSKPTQASAINFNDWQVIKVNNLVIGRIKSVGGGYS